MRASVTLSVAVLVGLSACGNSGPLSPTLTVAAAANLTGAIEELAAAFERESGVKSTLSLGSTAQLAQQLTNGAPFDLLLAADNEHVEKLTGRGVIAPGTGAAYALGRVALWIPDESRAVKSLEDLTRPEVKFIAVAQPELAPYGLAAIEAMRHAGIWERVRAKIVYANNISMARQMAASGNADAAFTALPLVMNGPGRILTMDPSFHAPIEQTLGIATASAARREPRAFREFVLGPRGRAILARRGYELPASR
ncbi:MAG: molybdate ABC transporter substrate-binding protein [Bryobacterales bacterium]|nr:molybdate ABC transporter substrate-binding protein [Bryobacterales bacterium]